MSPLEQLPHTTDVASSATPTEAEPLPPPPTSPTNPNLHLSVIHGWGNHRLLVSPVEWRAICTVIIRRDNRTCASCVYMSPHPKGRGLRIGHRNRDVYDNDHTNLRVHCPPCEAIRNCRISGIEGRVCLASSDMEQVKIVRKTRKMFEESGKIPRVREVDPLATRTDITIIDLADKLKAMKREELTEEEKGLRGFFTPEASDWFAITMAPEQSDGNPSDAEALKILAIDRSLPWIRFSPESHSTLQTFLCTWLPSHTSQSQVAWICVDNARPQPVDNKSSPDRSGICQAWDDICTDRRPGITDLDELARRFDVRGGKWLVFSRPGLVDSTWSRIAKATHAGKLGISSKVSPRDDSDSHVICIFTRDYTDETDVERVRNGLRRLGMRRKIGYKPDIYTYCRVYRDNSWQISPTRYYD